MVLAFFQSIMDWLRSLFFKQEMELSLIGLQGAGKTSLVNVLATGGYSDDMIPTVGFNMRKVRWSMRRASTPLARPNTAPRAQD